MTELTARELLLMLYDTALDAVDGHLLVNQWCRQNLTGNVSSQPKKFTHCIAIGKAAPAMLQGALDFSQPPKQSLLICPPAKITRALTKNKAVTCITSSHPVPDEMSLAAGDALITFLSNMSNDDELLVLISGGASSLVEMLAENISLEQLQNINNYLLASGKDIHQMNAWRQKFSQIKGGGLLNWVKGDSVTQLLLSDVKGDKAEFIGSGLLLHSDVTTEFDEYLKNLSLVANAGLPKDKAEISVNTHIIGNIKKAMLAVHDVAIAEGLSSVIYDEFLEGDVSEVAEKLYSTLQDAKPGIHIWGGETTVCLPEKIGVGGRNLSLALRFAEYLSDTPDLHLLAAGTDGVDGNSKCAGAVVSMYTSMKATSMGFDIKKEIEKANAGIVLMATDDLVRGEHSNTNVMDIVIAYKL